MPKRIQFLCSFFSSFFLFHVEATLATSLVLYVSFRYISYQIWASTFICVSNQMLRIFWRFFRFFFSFAFTMFSKFVLTKTLISNESWWHSYRSVRRKKTSNHNENVHIEIWFSLWFKSSLIPYLPCAIYHILYYVVRMKSKLPLK